MKLRYKNCSCFSRLELSLALSIRAAETRIAIWSKSLTKLFLFLAKYREDYRTLP
jgi:hypothetical protein